VRRAIASNIENKRAAYDLVHYFNSVHNAWADLNLTRITQGNDVFARIGRRVNVRSIEIKGAIAQGATGVAFDDSYNVMRIILALWTGLATSNSAPLGSSSFTINSPISPWNSGVSSTAYRMQRKYLDIAISLSVLLLVLMKRLLFLLLVLSVTSSISSVLCLFSLVMVLEIVLIGGSASV